MFDFIKLVFPKDLKPRGYWTKDHEKIPGSEFQAPEGTNDVTIYRIAIQFTKDGKPIGPPHLPPDGANDVHIDLLQNYR